MTFKEEMLMLMSLEAYLLIKKPLLPNVSENIFLTLVKMVKKIFIQDYCYRSCLYCNRKERLGSTPNTTGQVKFYSQETE